MALPSPLSLALAVLGTTYGHCFSTVILISLVDVWKSRTNTDAAWQLNTWTMRSLPTWCSMVWFYQWHAGCTLHALCYLISAMQYSLDLPATHRTSENFIYGDSAASPLYQPTHLGVSPSRWAKCNGRASGRLCTRWPSVSFTFPTGWNSC